jgi:hypothetical protein
VPGSSHHPHAQSVSMATRPRGDSGAFFVATPPSKIEGAIMNKSLLTIIVGLAIAFFSAPSRAGENYIYKIMTCFHGHPWHSDGCSLPDTGRRYRSLEECARTADALNGNNRMDRHISYNCFPD